ncbi:LacI family DNA-binding transcriptional regulator [Agromyces aurantiacus]|uniref:LacI family DNA-binding transcriptional regulator n=1 Tax=Agromyces aurantiacus TaxID=165814 RepID=A0ABV9R742_9MICO|nr:substrate-binding domain-containing protein [Agromyces aurantiacus]MBM7503967.1 DNA-binding LacI/PurR family transcriptional regulator [Agromyces aurantiacus]
MAAERRVTLAFLAAQAGVSLTTISKVLNGHPDVAADTRSRVEDLLRRSGYRRRGSGRRSTAVELVLPDLHGALSLELIDGVREGASASGHSLTLTVAGDAGVPDGSWLDALLERRPAAVIVYAGVAPSAREMLRSRGVPVVVLEPADAPEPGIPAMGVAHWSAAVTATRHLIGLGHRRIAAISGPESVVGSHARLDGFRSAMHLAGLSVPDGWARFDHTDAAAGERAALELLASSLRPTAILAGSDMQALGVLNAVRGLGLRIPEDVSLVGYDDEPVSSSSSPRLTTVHQPLRELGLAAARLALRLDEDLAAEATRVDFAATLVLRDSTGPPPPEYNVGNSP